MGESPPRRVATLLFVPVLAGAGVALGWFLWRHPDAAAARLHAGATLLSDVGLVLMAVSATAGVAILGESALNELAGQY